MIIRGTGKSKKSRSISWNENRSLIVNCQVLMKYNEDKEY